MSARITLVIVAILALSLVQTCAAQYLVQAFYLDQNCTNTPLRESYIRNDSCVATPCYFIQGFYAKHTCASSIPNTPGTLAIVSYPSGDCTGNPSSVGVYTNDYCIPNPSTGLWGKLNCNGNYNCTDSGCKTCNIIPYNFSCTATSRGSTEYSCNPAVGTTSASSFLLPSFVSAALMVIMSLF